MQAQDAPVAQQLAQQHVGQRARIDVAAADRNADRLAGEALGEGQHGGEARGARALGHHLAPSASRAMASSTARSGTTSTSMPRRFRIAKGSSPTSRTAMPSATVGPPT
jgi:hypothetical protein